MLKVLIVEDDLMIADMAEEMLVSFGYEVCGIARTVTAAVALSRRHKPDLAIIDLRLADGGFGTEIAAQMGGLGSPRVLYASGNIPHGTLTPPDRPARLPKPHPAPPPPRGPGNVA